MPFANAKLYKKKSGRPKKGYSKTGSKKGRPTVAAVKTIVKKAIARNVENKTNNYLSTGTSIYPSNSASFLSSIIPLSPYPAFIDIDQGPAQGERIGNKIKIKSLRLKGVMYPRGYSATNNLTPQPVQVIFWLLYDKQNSTIIPAPGADFLQFGNASIALQNDLVDCWAPVNTDRYRVLKKKVFKLGFADYSGTGTNVVSQSYTNNDFSLNKTFSINLTDYVIENVKFNDNNTSPTTRGLFWMFTAVNALGTNMSATTIPASMQWNLSCDYEDA